MSAPAVYRLRQGLSALFAFASPVDADLASEYLSPDLLKLFQRLKRGEQLHSLRVLRTVSQNGAPDRDLMVAALLHDVGKTRYPLAIWQKTLAVLVRAFFPALYAWFSAGDPRNLLLRPFVVSIQHPIWSADMLRAASAGESAVWLAEHHQDDAASWVDHPLYPLLIRLQVADNLH